MQRPSVLILGWFSFAEGSAGANYVVGVGKALRQAGCRVEFLPCFGPLADRSRQASTDVGGMLFLPAAPRRILGGWRDFLARFGAAGESSLQWLAQAPASAYSHVLAYSGHCAYLLKLRRLCIAKGWRLGGMVVEWYDPRHMDYRNPLSGVTEAVDSELQRRWLNRSLNHNICISSYLESYYRQHGGHTVLVPPLVDLRESKWPTAWGNRPASSPLRLVFAGNVRHKEDLPSALRGLAALDPAVRRRFELRLVGTTREELAARLGEDAGLLTELAPQLSFPGVLAHRAALREVEQGDFSILLRPNQRFANAGFPTKFVESMACGTPVIGNLTSDLGRHLHDGVEGIVVSDSSPGAFAAGLRRMATMSPDAIAALRPKARHRAEQSFDFPAYTARLHDFIHAMEPIT